MLDNLPEPYKFTQFDNKSKSLGHMTTADKSTTHAVTDRLNKANGACETIRNSSIANINIPIKHRLITPHAPFASILLYSLHFPNIDKGNVNRLRRFHKNVYAKLRTGEGNLILINKDRLILTYALLITYQLLKSNLNI